MIKNGRIDTVTLDLWNTLIAHDEHYDNNIRRIRTEDIIDALAGESVHVSGEDVERAYVISEKHLNDCWSAEADMDTYEQVELFLKCMNITPEPRYVKAVENAYAGPALKWMPFLIDGAREAVEDIKSSGYRVALISNTGRTPGRTMRTVMERFGILELFDLTVFSNEVGYVKPSPKIFESTLSRLGSSPERAVHIGDHSVLDVLGAKRAGMRAIQVIEYAGTDDRKHAPDAYIETIRDVADAISGIEG